MCGAATLVKCCRVAKYKDVKVLWGWMAPRRVVGVWAWSSLHPCSCCWNPTSQRSGLPTAVSSSCHTLLQMRIITSLLEIL